MSLPGNARTKPIYYRSRQTSTLSYQSQSMCRLARLGRLSYAGFAPKPKRGLLIIATLCHLIVPDHGREPSPALATDHRDCAFEVGHDEEISLTNSSSLAIRDGRARSRNRTTSLVDDELWGRSGFDVL